jgi:nucleoside 2-deoxyribosyltransferase
VAFELGYAYAHGIPAILISEDDSACQANAMLTGSAQAIIGNILDPQSMQILAKMIHGFVASYAPDLPRAAK